MNHRHKERGRWWQRRMLGSPSDADHLDSTHICLNNPENWQKTSRMDSLEPNIDKRPMEEDRKTGGSRGSGGAAHQARQSLLSLACKSPGARLREFWQPAGLNIWNIKSQQLCSLTAGRARAHQVLPLRDCGTKSPQGYQLEPQFEKHLGPIGERGVESRKDRVRGGWGNTIKNSMPTN